MIDFQNVIGQEQVKNLLERARQNQMNVLLVGPPGYGKTLFAQRYLESMAGSGVFGGGILEVNGSERTKVIVDKIKQSMGKPILIDEAHQMRNAEAIYRFIDKDGESDFGIPGFDVLEFMGMSQGHGGIFALATTDEGDLPDALVSRLVKVVLRSYSEEEIATIASIEHAHQRDALRGIARLARGNPRRAKLLSSLLAVRRPRSSSDVEEMLRALGYPMGLDERESHLLRLLEESPTGISTLAGLMGTNNKTVRSTETELIAAGLLIITNKGRQLTQKGLAVVQDLKPRRSDTRRRR